MSERKNQAKLNRKVIALVIVLCFFTITGTMLYLVYLKQNPASHITNKTSISSSCYQLQPTHSLQLIRPSPIDFLVSIADTAQSQELGLSRTCPLAANQGMYFSFTNQPKQIYNFWMKDMLYPIDIVWLYNKQVMDITYSAMPEPGIPLDNLKLYSPTVPINEVIELPAGSAAANSIKVGDAFSQPEKIIK